MLQVVPWLVVAILTFFLVDWYRRQTNIPNFARKFVFLTGCDTGFGKLLVRRLDALGCHVIAGCLTEAGQLELRSVCTPRVKTLNVDVTDQDSVRRAYDFVARIVPALEGGPLDTQEALVHMGICTVGVSMSKSCMCSLTMYFNQLLPSRRG